MQRFTSDLNTNSLPRFRPFLPARTVKYCAGDVAMLRNVSFHREGHSLPPCRCPAATRMSSLRTRTDEVLSFPECFLAGKLPSWSARRVPAQVGIFDGASIRTGRVVTAGLLRHWHSRLSVHSHLHHAASPHLICSCVFLPRHNLVPWSLIFFSSTEPLRWTFCSCDAQ